MKKAIAWLLVCALCLALVPGITLPVSAATAPSIIATSITLSGVLGINFKVDPGDESTMDSYTVRFRIGNDTKYQLISTASQQDGLYVYTAALPVARMHEQLRVQLLRDSAVYQTKDFTIAGLITQMKSQYADEAALHTLLDAMADYGTYAAYYMDTDSVLTGSVSVDALTANTLSGFAHTVKTANTELAPVVSLRLDEACDLRIKFNTAAWSDSTLYVNGEAISESALITEGGKTIYEINQMLPQDWSEMYNFQVVQNGTVVYELDYSVLSYCYIHLQKDVEVRTGLNGLLKAMYLYGTAVEAYALRTTPWTYGTGMDENGNYNSTLFSYNQLLTYVGDPSVIYISEEEDAAYGGYYYMYGGQTSDYGPMNLYESLDAQYEEQGVVSYSGYCFRSKDMSTWEAAGSLARLYCFLGYDNDWADWSGDASMWACEVIRDPSSGKYYMYYTAAGRVDDDNTLGWSSDALSDSGLRHLLGVAVSDTPVGPFSPCYTETYDNGIYKPLFDFEALAGSEYPVIDPNPFLDTDGTLYLYFKEEGEAGDSELRLLGMKMTSFTQADYTTIRVLESNRYKNVTGTTTGSAALTTKTVGTLMASTFGSYVYNKHDFYDSVIEAPCMYVKDGVYYLTYSRCGVTDPKYSVWYSVGTSPLGNFTTEMDDPILSGYYMTGSDQYVSATGHHCIVEAGEEAFIIYHTQANADNVEHGMGRYAYTDRVIFDTANKTAVANGPSESLQWLPSSISGYENIAASATLSGVTSSYLTDGVIPYYSYNSSQVASVTNGTEITLSYSEPVYARAIMIYNALTESSSYDSVSIELTGSDGKVYTIDSLTFPEIYTAYEYISCAPTVAEFSEFLVDQVKITVYGSNSSMNIPEIVVLGREQNTAKPQNYKLDTAYGDICYGKNGTAVTVDGSLDEALWQNAGSIVYAVTDTNGSAVFKIASDGTGVYFAADIQDSTLCYTGNQVINWNLDDTSTYQRNSSITWYFYPIISGESCQMDSLEDVTVFNLDLAGNIRSSSARVKKAITWDQSANTACIECFISWEDLGVSDDSKVTALRAIPQYFHVAQSNEYQLMMYTAETRYANKNVYPEFSSGYGAVSKYYGMSYNTNADRIETTEAYSWASNYLPYSGQTNFTVSADITDHNSYWASAGFTLMDENGQLLQLLLVNTSSTGGDGTYVMPGSWKSSLNQDIAQVYSVSNGVGKVSAKLTFDGTTFTLYANGTAVRTITVSEINSAFDITLGTTFYVGVGTWNVAAAEGRTSTEPLVVFENLTIS